MVPARAVVGSCVPTLNDIPRAEDSWSSRNRTKKKKEKKRNEKRKRNQEKTGLRGICVSICAIRSELLAPRACI